MEGSFQGDLADVVRASGGGMVSGEVAGNARVSDFPVDQLPLIPLNICEGFGDPFSSMRDPLLVELEGIGHGSLASSSPASSFHGDHFIGEASTAFQISCRSDNDHNNKSINCDLRGFTPCDLRGVVSDGLMNPISPKGSSSLCDSTTRAQISSPRNPILKRRKSQAKKVVCIPAPTAVNSRQGGGEVVPSDLWAWRKYGQKPIKGSPYPRGYYRCSSSKGCSARKQVERSRTDPNMLVITYTSEHNHPWPTQRNSLAGSSRIPAAATSSSSKPQPTATTTVKVEAEPNVTKKDVAESKSSVKGDHRDVILPSQLMMNELAFDYDKSYRPVVMQEEEVTDGQLGGSDHDFFADLRELEEPDPLNLLFNRGYTGGGGDDRSSAGGNKSMLDDVDDPFGSLFDWSTSNSNATTTTNSDRHENSL
ncbi:hypothetical protein V2J09_015407 [Rumex salicifolius]